MTAVFEHLIWVAISTNFTGSFLLNWRAFCVFLNEEADKDGYDDFIGLGTDVLCSAHQLKVFAYSDIFVVYGFCRVHDPCLYSSTFI